MPEEKDWEPAMEWIGVNVLEQPVEGAEEIAKATIRRQLEVLEMDCPLHYDEEVAKQHGYQGVFAPYHMLLPYAFPANWEPGMSTRWTSDDPNFTPPSVGSPRRQIPFPPTSAGFATDVEVEYFQPLYVGDTVTMTEDKMLSITPRNTRVGVGAFVIFEQRYVNQRGELVAIAKRGGYQYDPQPMVNIGPGDWKRADE